ncbi:DUF1454 family protein [Enterobacteriaceae bacterium ESL0689]|nr:DUF1454 family protein [Enterobacteriaceae bacterium ESL0689]
MKAVVALCLIGLSILFATQSVLAAPAGSPATAPYLLAGAPTFDLSISEFREKFNADNPSLALDEFRAIVAGRQHENLMRAASRINKNLYASTALEYGTLKIKSMQITWLPVRGSEQKAAKSQAQAYMSAMLRIFMSGLSPTQSQQKVQNLLTVSKGKRYFTETEGAIRYVVADNGEKGLTFAVEPIKLTLAETLDSNTR